jgi:hypothetical protein
LQQTAERAGENIVLRLTAPVELVEKNRLIVLV